MGSVIEEHTTQLAGIDRKERLLAEREEELKNDKNELRIEWEKCRQMSLQNQRRERKLTENREEKSGPYRTGELNNQG